MEAVEKGVANFKAFQTEARDFFIRSDERARQREKKEEQERLQAETRDKRRARMHFWWLGILSGIIVLGFGAILSLAVNFIETHHISLNSQHSESSPQDAGLPFRP